MEEQRGNRFFKVLVGDFAQRLEIPQDFLSQIPEINLRNSDTSAASSAKVVLKYSEGNNWIVELEKIGRCVFLTTGWPKFVKDNSLREYEFLVFRYVKDMHFMISVFGWNACEKVIRISGSGDQAAGTGSLEGKVSSDIVPSNKRGYCGDKLTETDNNPTHSQLLVETPDQSDMKVYTFKTNTDKDGHISSQSFPDLHLHEVVRSEDELNTYLSSKGPMEVDKAKLISEVMGRLHLDKVTIDLLCATLCFYKWNVDAAAEDFNICRGKPQIQNEILKQKLVLQFDLLKRQLRHFFPSEEDCSTQIHDRRKSSLSEPNLLNQPQQSDLTAVKFKQVNKHELCNLSHKGKRRISSETPRRSPRLAQLKSSHGSTENVMKEGLEVLESSPASTMIKMGDRAGQPCICYEKSISVLEGNHQEMIGPLSQDFKRFKPARGEVGLIEEPQHNEGDTKRKIYQGNRGEICEKQMEINAVENSESLMRRSCIKSILPTNFEVSTYLRGNELHLTCKPSEHANPLERILFDIHRENFTNTISFVQRIVQNHPPDPLCAAVIEAVMKKEILKWSLCLEDMNAQRIVIALLEHAKKIKDMHSFNMEIRKQEFSAKLQDHMKWQFKELETVYTSLELDYKKAASDTNVAVLTFQEQKKKLQTLQDEIKDLQQSAMEEDKMQNLTNQVAEHENLVHKSLLERVRLKTVLKSYEQTLVEVKDWLASTELGLIDVEALVKVEMDNMHKNIELSKKSLLNLVFMY